MTTIQKIETYQMTALNGSGRPVRKATAVTLACGRTIRFMERLSKREAIRQTERLLERESR